MKLRSKVEIRRARPLLGTIVDLSGNGPLECGFAAIAKVHRLMSVHDPASDISRLNRDGFAKPVRVHPWTWRVLKAAQEFAQESDGIFDVTAANRLGNWRDIILEKNHEVRFRRRVVVDLGGIAKGFAVDRAVDALRRAGVSSGIVNAGGDLRVFGPVARAIHLRNPVEPTLVSGTVRARHRAIATSATYFAHRALIDGQTGRAMIDHISVTVAAAGCMTADALTKIMFVLREKAAPFLARHGADALLLERDGSPCWRFHAPCDTRDRNRSD
jgi:thiamine biosynthesis lipoprotein